MKILITSGGTVVPIDTVRRITNMSSGTFGSKIATEALKMGHDVMFLRAAGSKSPFTFNVDLYREQTKESRDRFTNFVNFYDVYRKRYCEQRFKTFDDYARELRDLIGWDQPDITILAAAVSDYGVENPHHGKIRSTSDQMQIQLRALPKLISQVKEWCPTTTLIGFKLLVNSQQKDLLAAAEKSLNESRCDMVVANDLSDIQAGKHRLLLVKPDGMNHVQVKRLETDPEDPNFLARTVILEAVEARRK